MSLYLYDFIMSFNKFFTLGFLLYMIINMGNSTELFYRVRRGFAWIWVLTCTMTVVLNIVYGKSFLIIVAYTFQNACAIALLIDVMKRGSRWRITLDDIYNIIDIYLSVYGELSIENEYDVEPLVNIIRDNRIMDIKKALVVRTELYNESENTLINSIEEIYRIDIRKWFFKCVRDIEPWHDKGTCFEVNGHYPELKYKMERLESEKMKG